MDTTYVAQSRAAAVATRIAEAFALEPSVSAVAWGGSWMTGIAEEGSDLDLYVYAGRPVPLAVRTAIAQRFAGVDVATELDNRFWEPGDEWRDAESGIWVDVMYRTPGWIEEQLAKVLVRHEASTGYSTCIWHNVRTARILFDRSGWFGRLRQGVERPYPEELRRAIVAMNQPILAGAHSSFRSQIVVALDRGDLVAVNHRVAAYIASYFDVLFALNRAPHPGEKRLVAQAEALCPLRPAELGEHVDRIVSLAGDGPMLLERIDALVADLDRLLGDAGLLPAPRS